MKNLLLIAFIGFLPLNLLGQQKMFIGDKIYDATDTFDLISKVNVTWNLEATICKDGNRGILLLKNDYFFKKYVGGEVIIYLQDNTIIRCQDRGKRDIVNDTSTSFYYLTPEELKKMSNSNIYTVRFYLVDPMMKTKEAWTVENLYWHTFQQEPGKMYQKRERIPFETANAIKNLFNL